MQTFIDNPQQIAEFRNSQTYVAAGWDAGYSDPQGRPEACPTGHPVAKTRVGQAALNS
jgi:hypothetical protein